MQTFESVHRSIWAGHWPASGHQPLASETQHLLGVLTPPAALILMGPACDGHLTTVLWLDRTAETELFRALGGV